jgi:hypothetical protein
MDTRIRVPGTKVVVLVDTHEPTVAQGAIGEIITWETDTGWYAVEFSDDRLLLMRDEQIRVATEEEIKNDFGNVEKNRTGSLYPAEYFLDEMNRLF